MKDTYQNVVHSEIREVWLKYSLNLHSFINYYFYSCISLYNFVINVYDIYVQAFNGFGFGDAGFQMSFGIGAFPFGLFASVFNVSDGRPPARVYYAV